MKHKKSIICIILAFIITIISIGKKEKDTSFLNDYKITEIVNVLSHEHELDEILASLTINDNGVIKTLEEIENEYLHAKSEYEKKLLLYKMYKLLLSARLEEILNNDAKYIYENIKLDSKYSNTKEKINLKDEEYIIIDKDFKKVVNNIEQQNLHPEVPISADTVYNIIKKDLVTDYVSIKNILQYNKNYVYSNFNNTKYNVAVKKLKK